MEDTVDDRAQDFICESAARSYESRYGEKDAGLCFRRDTKPEWLTRSEND